MRLLTVLSFVFGLSVLVAAPTEAQSSRGSQGQGNSGGGVGNSNLGNQGNGRAAGAAAGSQGAASVPELDPSALPAALALVAGATMVVLSRRRKAQRASKA